MIVFAVIFIALSSAWGIEPSKSNSIDLKSETVGLSNKISRLERDISDAKIRDSALKEKIQHDEIDFYHGAMSYFNNVITVVATIIGTVVAIVTAFAIKVYIGYLQALKRVNEAINESKNNNNKMQHQLDEKLEIVEKQTRAINEFMLGRDHMGNLEVDETKQAIKHFKKAKDLWPQFELSTIYLGIALKLTGDFKTAFKHLEACSESPSGITAVGVAHLFEAAILTANEKAIERIREQHQNELEEFGGGKFLPFMEALLYFSRKDVDNLKRVVEIQKKDINLKSKHYNKKHLHWSFDPAKEYLNGKNSYAGYDIIVRHIELLDGVSCCDFDDNDPDCASI